MATKTVKCLCSTFEFGVTVDVPETGDVDFQGYTTDCAQTTNRVFAMGHDAKLAGYLVRAELGGEEIVWERNGVRHIFGSAVNAAGQISDAFAAKVQTQLDAAKVRLANKAVTAARKAAKKSAKKSEAEAPTTRLATIKVGRWVYTASIELATGEATYSNKDGKVKKVASDKYTEQA